MLNGKIYRQYFFHNSFKVNLTQQNNIRSDIAAYTNNQEFFLPENQQ